MKKTTVKKATREELYRTVFNAIVRLNGIIDDNKKLVGAEWPSQWRPRCYDE